MKYKTEEEAAEHAWSWLRNLMKDNRSLSTEARLLLFVLVGLELREGTLNPKLDRLALMTSLSEDQCKAAHAELLAAGVLHADGRGVWQ